ncbi:MAG: DUF305 domain-containing protein [Candidatus Paceibacterota bacterium]
MNNKIMFGVGGVVLGVIIVLLLSNISGYRGMMYGNNFRSNGGVFGDRVGGDINRMDSHFIEQMIPHHEGAIDMATLALTKATHPEIKTLAIAIIEAQNKEIVDMKSWYKDWFDADVPKANTSRMGGGMMSGRGMHMGGTEDMSALENASDFDKAFIEGMIPHHQLAVMMAQMLKAGTNRPEMLTLANNIIESQTKEIEQMQGWYNTWYK